jgi:hypothetical protein
MIYFWDIFLDKSYINTIWEKSDSYQMVYNDLMERGYNVRIELIGPL